MRARQSQEIKTGTRHELRNKLAIGGGAGALILAAVLMVFNSASESLSGVINDYAVVTAMGTSSVTVDNASAFAAGDKILLIQMKGAMISETDDATYGDVTDYGNAGNYEFNTIDQVSGNTLELVRMVCGDYDVSDLVQVVRVPVYEDASVDGTLKADAWNGSKGGILALEVTGTLHLAADMDVRSKGFRGGDLNGAAQTGGLTYICAFNSGQGGIKGEGIIEIPAAACRGKLANGGGGGNDHNGGGGGGGNYGSGGLGGHGWKSNNLSNLSDTDKGGRGGLSLEVPYLSGVPKLFLGGGGGGGHQNNGASVPAAHGSGIIILIAGTVEVDPGVKIRANAKDATDVRVNDGAGGGGAGGSVLLDVQNWTNPTNLTVDVSGGDGASVYTADQHGPGGGGGGGLIHSTRALPAIQAILGGGAPGLFVSSNSSHPLHNTPHGSTAGAAGMLLTNLVLQICSEPPVIDLDATTAGKDYQTSYTTRSSAVPIAQENNLSISDGDDINMNFALIELVNPFDEGDEGLEMTLTTEALTSLGLTLTVAPDGHSLTLQGQASLAIYQQAIAAIGYFHNGSAPDLNDRILEVFVNDGGANSNTAITTISLIAGSLPVEWLYFEGNTAGEDGILKWATARELNSNYFEVERSEDGSMYMSLDRVPSAGTTENISEYQFRDVGLAQQVNGVAYYRLRQVDLDGTFDYSKTIELRPGEAITPLSLTIYPNPVKGQATLKFKSSGSEAVNLRIVSISGQVMWQQSMSEPGGSEEISLDLSQWPTGIYYADARSDTQQATFKIVKE